MARILDEIKLDLNFIKSHALQPKWYKILKAVFLVGFLMVYFILFGSLKTAVFLSVFLCLNLLMHMLYRVKTDRWVKSWLDFVVVEENDALQARSIGKFYYSMVILNAAIALLCSQLLSVE